MKLTVLPVVFFLACTTTPSSAAPPTSPKGKPTAPVEVSAELWARSARLLVTFESDAKDVELTVSGVDGLVVEGEGRLVRQGAFARGETRTFDVAFTPGPGRSMLVVSVRGSFNGAVRARVASFTVGTGPLPKSPGEVITTDDGEKVKVMPQ
jgi:hypothetical protein